MTSVEPQVAHDAHQAAVFAVVVSYRCNHTQLMIQFEKLLEQVAEIVWIDNGSGEDLKSLLAHFPESRIHPIWLERNLGIAAAQNMGIEFALTQCATHVLLMDHDSIPGQSMVSNLLQALDCRPDAAAVGPCYTDMRREGQRTPFFKVENGWRLQWLACSDPKAVWTVDHVIASGCLIPAAVLRQVGLMRSEFFIDWVDVEWCLRARKLGYKIFGVCAANLEHHLGDQVIKIFGREIPLHAPWRHYYQARNLVLTLCAKNVEKTSRLHHILQQLKRFVLFSTCVPGRIRYLKMWLLGLLHGLMRVNGRVVAYDPRGEI